MVNPATREVDYCDDSITENTRAAYLRGNFPLVSGPPQISNVTISSGQARLTASGLLNGHSYVEQTTLDLTSGNWSSAISFTATQTLQTLTNAISNSPCQFWRILAP